MTARPKNKRGITKAWTGAGGLGFSKVVHPHMWTSSISTYVDITSFPPAFPMFHASPARVADVMVFIHICGHDACVPGGASDGHGFVHICGHRFGHDVAPIGPDGPVTRPTPFSLFRHASPPTDLFAAPHRWSVRHARFLTSGPGRAYSGGQVPRPAGPIIGLPPSGRGPCFSRRRAGRATRPPGRVGPVLTEGGKHGRW